MLDISNKMSSISWNDIIDVSECRSNLGECMPIGIHRLFQYNIRTILCEDYGQKTMNDIFRKAGEKTGQEFTKNELDITIDASSFFSMLQKQMITFKIGILRIENYNEQNGDIIMTVSEDCGCSGLSAMGNITCAYQEGFLTGILTCYTNKHYTVKEIDCWLSDGRVCRYEGKINR